jgi:uncharacterized membrane protein YgcG
MRMEREMRESLASLEISADERNNMTSMVTSMHGQYQDSMRSILNNPDMAAEDRNGLLSSASDLLQLQTSMIENLYNVDIDWDVSSYSPTGSTSGGDSGSDSGGSSGGTGGSGSTSDGPKPGYPGYRDPSGNGNINS